MLQDGQRHTRNSSSFNPINDGFQPPTSDTLYPSLNTSNSMNQRYNHRHSISHDVAGYESLSANNITSHHTSVSSYTRPSISSYTQMPSVAPGSLYINTNTNNLHYSPHMLSAQRPSYTGYPQPTNLMATDAKSLPCSPSTSSHLDTRRSSMYPSISDMMPNSTTPSTSGIKYMPTPKISQSNQYGNSSSSSNYIHSPLTLNQIRPRADSIRETDLAYSPSHQIPCTHTFPWPVYAFDWCKWPVHASSGHSLGAGKMAVGSYLEDPVNYIQIVDTEQVENSLNDSIHSTIHYSVIAETLCSYPITRVLWEPPSSSKPSDLLASSGDHLRLWSLPTNLSNSQSLSNCITRSSHINQQRGNSVSKLIPLALLSNSKTPDHTAPLTSLDWNYISPQLIITSSIDTTCTIWDIPTLTAKTQLIAHDKEVYDVRFCAGSVDVFLSCGADGSVRMFDLRSLEHSTIIYEPSSNVDTSSSHDAHHARRNSTITDPSSPLPSSIVPLLRLAASPYDSHLLATLTAASNIVRILDVRQPGQTLLQLQGHHAQVNSVEWCPLRRGILATGGDDCLAHCWNLIDGSSSIVDLAMHNGSSSSRMDTYDCMASTMYRKSDIKEPIASWSCDMEILNISWAPHTSATPQSGDWIGVVGGRNVWAVKT